jgi:flagellar motility protein MotE (MotC chaperone)
MSSCAFESRGNGAHDLAWTAMTSGMTETSSKRSAATSGAKLGERDFMTRLADAGEEALQRIAELPGGQRALTAVNDLRARVDDLTKKVRGIDALEARVAKLEKELAALKRGSKPKPTTPKT